MKQSPSEPESQDQALRRHLTDLLRGGNAHASLEKAISDLPGPFRSIKPDKLPYSIWKLLEHIRITQLDILEFSRNAAHRSPHWPDEYWPREDGPSDEEAWQRCLQQIQQDKEAFITLLNDSQNDLYAPFPHGDGQTLLREALLIADHTSYHAGQIIVVRRLLGAWQN